jgi:DNA-binding CsgD family transcriptional regulator/tetratricopeptide (TPR) repeat protein
VRPSLTLIDGPPISERGANPVLLGRHRECAVLDTGLAAVRKGQSWALVLRGEAGVGKTALLNYLVQQATGCQVVRAAGVQSEMELAFSGLYQLCAPSLDRADRLPTPQRDALLTAFGVCAGDPPDRFLVSLAALGLLAEVAQERPLVCVVDDAQWLDRASAQALAFIARRVEAESIALVFSAREVEVSELTGLPALVVEGLPLRDARALLRSAVCGPVDDRVIDRLIAETRGNPLALLELPRGFTQAELSAGFALLGPRTVSERIEQSYRRRLGVLGPETLQLLLVAAAEPLGNPVLVWRASERLGIGMDALGPAAAAGLLEIGTCVRFRHPLVRSAIYWAASPAERRATHGALAEATNGEGDPDRRAWHHAQAASLPDGDIAAELEVSADRAQARGGPAAAAAFLERAAQLTPDPALRADRALAAARAAHLANEPDTALRLLSIVDAGPQDKTRRARVDELRAQVAFANVRGGDTAALFLRAATQLELFDARLARDAYLDGLSAAMFSGAFTGDDGLLQVARAARAAPSARPTRPHDVLLDGLATRFTDGYAAGVPALKQALAAFVDSELTAEEGRRWLWLAHCTAVDVWDEETWAVLPDLQVRLIRDSGSLATLPLALSMRVGAHVLLGELSAAASLIAELARVTEVTGSHLAPYGALLLAAWEGREFEGGALIDSIHDDVARRGEGIGLAFASWSKALLYGSLGKYELAIDAAHQVVALPHELGAPTWGALVETIEAASRCGREELGSQAFERLTSMTRASGTDWALGIEARSRALLGGPAAEGAYLEAIERLKHTRIRGELARSHLLYGEWLRRNRRVIDARHRLRTAHHMFTVMGAEAFAKRAARELQAAGGTARKRKAATNGELTPQEAHIVRLVREELSNQDIGARLFISPRTVEWHLSKIFAKLGVTSRRHLQR